MQILGVSSDTVCRWINRFGMPAHRMSSPRKFKNDQVDAWLSAQRQLLLRLRLRWLSQVRCN